MRASSLFLLLGSLTGVTLAQTTVIQFLAAAVPDLDTAGVPLSASVVDVNAVATTLSLNDCGGVSCEAVIIEGPSTFAYNLVLSTTSTSGAVAVATVTLGAACQITASTSAVCTVSDYEAVSFDGSSSMTSSVNTLTYGTDDMTTITITATDGVSKFQQPQATQTPAAAPRPVIAQGAAAPFGVAFDVAVAGLL